MPQTPKILLLLLDILLCFVSMIEPIPKIRASVAAQTQMIKSTRNTVAPLAKRQQRSSIAALL